MRVCARVLTDGHWAMHMKSNAEPSRLVLAFDAGHGGSRDSDSKAREEAELGAIKHAVARIEAEAKATSAAQLRARAEERACETAKAKAIGS